MEVFKHNTNIQFIQNRRFFLILSLIVTILFLGVMHYKGFNYGIDFRGGVKLAVQFNQNTSDGAIQSALTQSGFDSIVQKLGTDKDQMFSIKTAQTEANLEDTITKVSGSLTAKYGADSFQILSQETVGPKVGKELRHKGFLAILFTLIAIMIYVSFRFDINYGPGAIISLFHDVIVVMGFMVLFNKEFNLTTLAALITIAGYSMNDTIIIFDRIRENSKRISNSTIIEVVNQAINQTLSRTITTHVTVFIVVFILFLFGGTVIHDFAFAFIVGVIVGAYSSIFVATPLYIFMYRHWPRIAVKLHLRKA